MNADPKERIVWTSNLAFGGIVLAFILAIMLLASPDSRQLGIGVLIGLGVGVASCFTMLIHATRNC